MQTRGIRLFVYGTLLKGQPDHFCLDAAELLGPAQTEPCYILVDLGPFAALVFDGNTAVHGELYLVDPANLVKIDQLRQVPSLFRRQTIALAKQGPADAYVMSIEQVRGKRRLSHGQWRDRFAPRLSPHRSGPMATWARERFSKG
jgi:gamma-glutamylcyclotransferase (GGCT)/AIG2-like uncharacterized protein YtfP